MPAYSLQVTLIPSSNVNADASTNTWSCDADDTTAAVAFKDAVLDFYDDMRAYYPALIRQSNHIWKVYNRADPEPRAPVAEGVYSFASAPSGNSLPTEVALCGSFQGQKTSGVPQARRRGRIYFGPIVATQIAPTARPSSTLVTALAQALDDLKTASDGAATWTWCVWSTVTGTNVPISDGWVDDEFDVQRRRGRIATSRTIYP